MILLQQKIMLKFKEKGQLVRIPTKILKMEDNQSLDVLLNTVIKLTYSKPALIQRVVAEEQVVFVGFHNYLVCCHFTTKYFSWMFSYGYF